MFVPAFSGCSGNRNTDGQQKYQVVKKFTYSQKMERETQTACIAVIDTGDTEVDEYIAEMERNKSKKARNLESDINSLRELEKKKYRENNVKAAIACARHYVKEDALKCTTFR